jgi:cyclic pyranopterin phosphate synthase
MPLEPLPPRYDGEVARRYRHKDGSGEIGVIASVTEPFCGACTRARLSADGHLYTCLFASVGVDLRPSLRSHPDDSTVLRQTLSEAWKRRDDRYSELRSSVRRLPKIEMNYIGG